MDNSERPERTGPDADAAEIAERMEEDFRRAVVGGMANAAGRAQSPHYDNEEGWDSELADHVDKWMDSSR
jgi:hypothetical protein